MDIDSALACVIQTAKLCSVFIDTEHALEWCQLNALQVSPVVHSQEHFICPVYLPIQENQCSKTDIFTPCRSLPL